MSRYSCTNEPAGYLVRIADDGHTIDVEAVGDFDMANATTLTSGLLDVLRQHRHVRVDMSKVAFLDVVCLDELIAMRRLFAAQGHRVALTRLSSPVRRLVDAAGVGSDLAGTAVGV
jgi:anti-anti-sigma factor